PPEQLLEGLPRSGIGERRSAEDRVPLVRPRLHDQVVEIAVARRDLQRERVALGAEGDLPERAVQLVDLAAHVDQVLAEPEDDVLGELLDRLFLRLRDPLAVLREAALAPE